MYVCECFFYLYECSSVVEIDGLWGQRGYKPHKPTICYHFKSTHTHYMFTNTQTNLLKKQNKHLQWFSFCSPHPKFTEIPIQHLKLTIIFEKRKEEGVESQCAKLREICLKSDRIGSSRCSWCVDVVKTKQFVGVLSLLCVFVWVFHLQYMGIKVVQGIVSLL